MLEKRYMISASGNAQPPPISALMQAANLFGCKIYIAAGSSCFDVKNYDELQKTKFRKGFRCQKKEGSSQ